MARPRFVILRIALSIGMFANVQAAEPQGAGQPLSLDQIDAANALGDPSVPPEIKKLKESIRTAEDDLPPVEFSVAPKITGGGSVLVEPVFQTVPGSPQAATLGLRVVLTPEALQDPLVMFDVQQQIDRAFRPQVLYSTRLQWAELIWNARAGSAPSKAKLVREQLMRLESELALLEKKWSDAWRWIPASQKEAAIARIKARIQETNAALTTAEKQAKADLKLRKAEWDKGKVARDLARKTGPALEELIAKNDRKGVAKLLRMFVPFALMEPTEKAVWESWIEAIEHPDPARLKLVFRGLAADRIMAGEDGASYVWSKMIEKNQGSYLDRLRSLVLARERIGNVNFDSKNLAVKKVDYEEVPSIAAMLKNHAENPVGSPLISYSNEKVAKLFTEGTDKTGKKISKKMGAFLIDERLLLGNAVSRFDENEVLQPLFSFPDEMVAIAESSPGQPFNVYELEAKLEKKLGRPIRDEEKVGVKKLAFIQASSYQFEQLYSSPEAYRKFGVLAAPAALDPLVPNERALLLSKLEAPEASEAEVKWAAELLSKLRAKDLAAVKASLKKKGTPGARLALLRLAYEKKDASSLPLIQGSAMDPDPVVHCAAIEMLGLIPEKNSVTALEGVIRSKTASKEAKTLAAQSLLKNRKPLPLDSDQLLKLASETPDPALRGILCQVMKDSAAAVPKAEYVRRFLEDPNPEVRLSASLALARLPEKEREILGADALRKEIALGASADQVTFHNLVTAYPTPKNDVTPANPLIQALRSPKPGIRLEAIKAFSGLKPTPLTLQQLEPLLTDSSLEIQITSARIIAQNPPLITPAMIDLMLGSQEQVVRSLGTQALSQLPETQATPLLRKWILEASQHISDPGLREIGCRLLKTLSAWPSPKAELFLSNQYHSGNHNDRLGLLSLLVGSELPPGLCSKILIAACKEPPPGLVLPALSALTSLTKMSYPAADSLPVLEAAMVHAKASLWPGIARAMESWSWVAGRQGNVPADVEKRYANLVLKLLATPSLSEDAESQPNLVAEVFPRDVRGLLIFVDGMKSPDPIVRKNTLTALAYQLKGHQNLWSEPRYSDLLAEALRDPDPAVRKKATAHLVELLAEIPTRISLGKPERLLLQLPASELNALEVSLRGVKSREQAYLAVLEVRAQRDHALPREALAHIRQVSRGPAGESSSAKAKLLKAYAILSLLDDPESRDFLRRAFLKSNNPDIRKLAALALTQRKDGEVQKLIRLGLKDPDPSVHHAALELTAKRGDYPAVLSALQDHSEAYPNLLRALARFPEKKAESAAFLANLTKKTGNRDDFLAALDALTELPDHVAVPVLERMMLHPEEFPVLGSKGNSDYDCLTFLWYRASSAQAVASLRKVAEDPKRLVHAIASMAGLKDPGAPKALAELVLDYGEQHSGLSDLLLNLQQITGGETFHAMSPEATSEWLTRLYQGASEKQRDSVLQFIGDLGRSDSIPPQSDPAFRLVARRILLEAKVDPKDGLPLPIKSMASNVLGGDLPGALREKIAASNAEERLALYRDHVLSNDLVTGIQASGASSKTRQDCFDLLKTIAQDPDPQARALLGQWMDFPFAHPEEWAGWVKAELKSPDPKIRQAFAAALIGRDKAEAMPLVEAALGSDDPVVHEYGLKALKASQSTFSAPLKEKYSAELSNIGCDLKSVETALFVK